MNLRVWDNYLMKGEIYLFELGSTIIKMQEKELKNLFIKDVLKYLKNFNQKYKEEEFFDNLNEINVTEEYKSFVYEINSEEEKGSILQIFTSELFY